MDVLAGDRALGEQDLASSGRVAAPSGAATGQVLGAEILVQVVITDYEEKTSGSTTGERTSAVTQWPKIAACAAWVGAALAQINAAMTSFHRLRNTATRTLHLHPGC